MNFSKYLIYLRKKSGLKIKELATKVDVTPTYISNFEHERNIPPEIELCQKIANALRLEETETKKLIDLAVEERYLEKEPLLREYGLGKSPQQIEVKNVEIPVVSMAKGTDVGGFEFEPIEPHDYEYIDFTGCKAVRIRGSSMAPLAYDGQRVIYSEKETVRDGDLVFIGLKGQGQFFKRYHKDPKNSIVTLLSINIANHGPLNTKTKDIEFLYRVVGVKF